MRGRGFRGLALAAAWAAVLAAVSAAPAEAPECFRLLSDGSGIAARFDAEPAELPRAGGWRPAPTEEEVRAGFVVGRAPTGETFHPARVWDAPRPECSVGLFAMRGEYRAAAVGVFALRDLDGLQARVTALSGPGGSRIDGAHTDLRVVRFLRCRAGGEELWVNRFLAKGFPPRIERDTMSFLWLSVHVPEDAAPGVYHGSLELAATAGPAVQVPVRVRVLEWGFRYPAGAWGAYLPGHFPRATDRIYHNYAIEGWSEANLERCLRFWNTRGLTSPSLFHVYPDAACVDGKAEVAFPEVAAVARAMKRVGMPGPLCIDVRHTLWWANAAGEALAARRAEGKDVSGRLDVPGAAGRMANRYGPDALRLWGEAIRGLLETADREGWPPVLLLPEEECSHTDKAASYDASVAAFLQAAGQRSLLVDNVIGYGRAGEIDRGHRDGIAVREYNNWTEQGLADARADGAQVWSYNLGWSRAAVWVYTLRTGSRGYHQWADQWLHDRFPVQWVATLQEADGVVTSTDMETFHEGLCDLAYARRLEEEADRLAEAGQAEASAAARGVLESLVRGVPLQRYEFLAWAATRSDADLDLQRWRLVEAIRQAMGGSVPGPAASAAGVGAGGAPSAPRLACAAPRQAGLTGNPARVVRANRVDTPVLLDGREEEPFWAAAERAGPLWWTAARERQMRARAGSLEEFRRMHPPSYASARFAYGAEGLAILVNCNHATRQNARCTHADDDPELWADDCMEFFFQMPHDPASIYQLIVNVRGARVLKRDRAVRPCAVRTGVISPVNASGGYAQEILVPWADLGLAGPPEPGVSWRLNVCREFHSWGEFTCWAQVGESFGLADGMLVFEGPAAEVALRDLDLGHRFAGRNRFSGRLERRRPGDRQGYRVELADDHGRTVAAVDVPGEGDRFEAAYEVPELAEPALWRLAVVRDGATAAAMGVTIPAAGPSVAAEAASVEVLAGFRAVVPVTVCVGDLDAAERCLAGELQDATGKVFPLAGTALRQAGPHRVWLDTDGLAPGAASLALWVDGFRERGAAAVSLQVVGAPFGP